MWVGDQRLLRGSLMQATGRLGSGTTCYKHAKQHIAAISGSTTRWECLKQSTVHCPTYYRAMCSYGSNKRRNSPPIAFLFQCTPLSAAEHHHLQLMTARLLACVAAGIWNDSLVAVKVIRVRCRRTSDRDADDAHVTAELARHEYESWLNANLRNPNIVQLFTSFTVGLEKPASSSSMGPFALDMAAGSDACGVIGAEAGVAGHAASGTVPSGLSWKTHLIMEYCDMGTMQVGRNVWHASYNNTCCVLAAVLTAFTAHMYADPSTCTHMFNVWLVSTIARNRRRMSADLACTFVTCSMCTATSWRST